MYFKSLVNLVTLASFAKAIELKPASAHAHFNHGNALLKLKRNADAVRSFARTLELSPDFSFAAGYMLHAKMLSCDWAGLSELCEQVETGIHAGKAAAEPFGYQAISASEHSLRRCAEIYLAHKFPEQTNLFASTKQQTPQKIRIGYVSGEFREQATSILMAELFELHDKTRFVIVAFDNGWDDGSDIRARINAACDGVVDISGLGDFEAATAIHERKIDILLNLNGYFGAARQGVFAHRPSPILVNYLGFPGTIGASYIDYLIADRTVIPEASRQHYTEKIVYLPDCCQANDTKRRIADKIFTRAELGLPESGFVFCCFNNNYKITPQTFDGWMRILKQVSGSVLWLIVDDATAAANLRQEAMWRGVTADRLIFAPRMPLSEHLARHAEADLFLDTLPYNAHTTASDALWAGLPLLTCTGTTFPGRVATSLLKAIGVPELIASAQNEFEVKAVELATHPERLAQTRQKLWAHRLTTPLFDSKRFTTNIENAYLQMYERYQAGLHPNIWLLWRRNKGRALI